MTGMPTRRLGRSGLCVSVVGLGCNNLGMKLDLEQSRPVVEAALDAGITLFDTADSYGDSEEILGALLRGRRDGVVLATKFGGDLKGANGPDWGARGGRRYVRKAVERSLRRLRTDWIDLYQIHYPDPATPTEETLSTLTDLVREGKVRYIGCSNFAAWPLADAEWTATTRGLERFVSAQNEYSLLERGAEAELVPACQRFGVGVLPYFPLASGVLTGKYRRGAPHPVGSRVQSWGLDAILTDDRFSAVERLEAYAAERCLTLLRVVIGGLAAQPAVASVIAGATAPDQVRANVRAAQWSPDPDDLAALDAIVPSRRPAARS
jgi:aryl-alcohol dehydrogenase-like predicted oxidoreductase